jgi:hypothetical protein
MQGYIAFYSHFVKKNVQASIFLAQFSLDQVIPYLNSISILLDLLELQGLIKKHDKLWGAQFHHDGRVGLLEMGFSESPLPVPLSLGPFIGPFVILSL